LSCGDWMDPCVHATTTMGLHGPLARFLFWCFLCQSVCCLWAITYVNLWLVCCAFARMFSILKYLKTRWKLAKILMRFIMPHVTLLLTWYTHSLSETTTQESLQGKTDSDKKKNNRCVSRLARRKSHRMALSNAAALGGWEKNYTKYMYFHTSKKNIWLNLRQSVPWRVPRGGPIVPWAHRVAAWLSSSALV